MTMETEREFSQAIDILNNLIVVIVTWMATFVKTHKTEF